MLDNGLGWYKASDANIRERWKNRMNWVLQDEVTVIRWNSETQNPRTQVVVQAAVTNWEMKSAAIVDGK